MIFRLAESVSVTETAVALFETPETVRSLLRLARLTAARPANMCPASTLVTALRASAGHSGEPGPGVAGLSPPTSANVASAGNPAAFTSVGFWPSQIIRDSAATAVA